MRRAGRPPTSRPEWISPVLLHPASMNAKPTLLIAAALMLAAALAGCADNDGVESSDPNDPGADGDCENRNLVDDDVMSDDDGVTLGECEENAADR